jgi:hypothetical protein
MELKEVCGFVDCILDTEEMVHWSGILNNRGMP